MKNPGLYILTHKGTGEQYVGKDSRLPSRPKEHLSGNAPECRHVHNAIQKYGRDAFSVEIIQYPGISDEALNAVERWKIRHLQTLSPGGFNLTEGGEGGNPSEETRQKISESNYKRVDEGTHHFLGGEISRRTNKKRVDEGTHHFLGGEVNKNRVADGTHHLLGGEIQRRTNKKRVDEGTHHFLGGEVNKNRVADGTHHLLGGEIQRRTNKKRVDEGTHNLLGDKNPVHKRVADGTHNFLGDKNPAKRLAKEGKHYRTIKRRKAEWCYIIALSRFWYEIHDYTLKRRSEFLSKDIPDTSNAEQTNLF